jgi:membrane-bound lytic murein transglycosylase D
MIKKLSFFTHGLLLLFIVGACGHLGTQHASEHDRAVIETELEACRDQLDLARELTALDDLSGAAQAYRMVLELLPHDELPKELQHEVDRLAEAALDEYHLLLGRMSSLPGETPAWAVVAEMDSTMEAAADTVAVKPPSGEQVYDMPVVMNTKVQRVMEYFTTKGREPFTIWLERKGRYEQIISDILREHGLPQDMIYLAMIESGFNTRAYSYAHAAGPWQFISGTGRKFGLTINWWVDERRDIVKSTHAACRYLSALYDMFGSWELALAAYNCGEGRVDRAIRRYKTNDFWQLRRLPRQTRNYVPTFMGAMVIAKNPEKYGFFVEKYPAIQWDEVELTECTSLDVAARCADTSYDEMKLLNPELRRGCTPPDVAKYTLRVPKGSGDTFLAEYAKIPDDQKVTWVRHNVLRGQTLSGIAARYGTSVAAIKEFNNLRSSHLIREGSSLVIPVPRGGSGSDHERWASVPGEEGTYRVRRGDTLGGIARRHGVSLSTLCNWNGLSRHATIYAGQSLRLWPGQTRSPSSASATGSASGDRLVYVVKRGDTLASIAARYGVTVQSLRQANAIQGSLIYPGQELSVASAGSGNQPNPAALGRYVVRRGDTLGRIAASHDMTVDELRRLNSVRGSLIHPGQTLLVAGSAGAASDQTEATETTVSSREITGKYVVKPGDTLAAIAVHHGMEVRDLMEANSLESSRIYPGQSLMVASSVVGTHDSESADKAQRDSQSKSNYVVRRGDTLAGIAARHGTTVDALRQANGISGSRIYPGQRLAVATTTKSVSDQATSQEPTEYVVKRGDTLIGIAKKAGVTVTDIRRVNGISGSRIYPGQRLVISDSASWAAAHPEGEAYLYLVKRGDSLYAISRRFGVTVADLRRWNELNADALLYPGTKLTLYPNNEEMTRAVGG